MITSIFGAAKDRTNALNLYEKITDASRDPVFYAVWGVADTLDGRFEVLTVHMFAVMHRLKGQGKKCEALSQSIVDVMFEDFDNTLREMGVGDMSIGRKMRDLASNFYGRIAAYEKAVLGTDDAGDLMEALARNIYQSNDHGDARHIHAYVMQTLERLEATDMANLLVAEIAFTAPNQ